MWEKFSFDLSLNKKAWSLISGSCECPEMCVGHMRSACGNSSHLISGWSKLPDVNYLTSGFCGSPEISISHMLSACGNHSHLISVWRKFPEIEMLSDLMFLCELIEISTARMLLACGNNSHWYQFEVNISMIQHTLSDGKLGSRSVALALLWWQIAYP